MASQANNPYPTLAMYEAANEYDRLNAVFNRLAQTVSKLSGHKVTIELDGASDEPAELHIWICGMDWSRVEEEAEETLADLLEAMKARNP